MLFKSSSMFSGVLLALLLAPGCGGGNDRPPTCAGDPGTLGCACVDGTTCDDGLVCSESLCASPDLRELSVGSPEVRGCEVLVTESDGVVANVTFASSLEGTFIRQAPRAAISFVTQADSAVPGGAIQVAVTGASSGVVLTTANCVDAAGAPVTNANVSLR
ncbi:MAG: hypothetical protein R3B40_26710 [Polyangiales bacterium]|nr:hypothetical protein [Myxococcales bacterium]MCB9656064.1 hypothetical protein [Sandaracinaceae bacterium]